MSAAFASLPFYGHLSKAEADSLAEKSRIEERSAGPLFPSFEPTQAFWFLLAGEWRVVRRVAGREELMFEATRPGSWTGGIPLIDSIAPVSAEVLRASRFASVPIATMHALAASNPRVAAWLLKGLEWGARHIGGLLTADAPQPEE